MTAGIYCGRRELKALIIAKSLGGQAALAGEVENWPGTDAIMGFELVDSFKKQVDKFGVEFKSNEVTGIEKTDAGFIVKTSTDEITATSVILAFGLTPRDLGVPGEDRLKGRGVTYCATCDGPLYKGKTVAVVGAGNAAMEAAEYLARLASKVYLVNNGDKFIGDAYLLDEVDKLENVETFCSTQVTEIKGENKVEGFVTSDASGQEKETAIDGIFIEIGHQAKTDWLKGLVELNDKGEIVISADNETSVAGIFAAGDCTNTLYKQIVIAAGEGAKAALQSYKHVVFQKGGFLKPDWGSCKKKAPQVPETAVGAAEA